MSRPTLPPSTHKENATINASSIRDRIAFYHCALLSPKFSTWCKAIKNVFLQYWPELLTKYTPIFEATVKGHMHAQQYNTSSTKKAPYKKIWTLPYQNHNPIRTIYKTEESYDDIPSNNTVTETPTASSPSLFHHKKEIPSFHTHHTYDNFKSITGKLCTDQSD